MLTREQSEAFWESRVAKLDTIRDPCHYMDHWMDKYTWETRTAALQKVSAILNAETLVDIGCGVGRYTEYLWAIMAGEGPCVGFDRVEFVKEALLDYAVPPYLDFFPGLVPDEKIEELLEEVDVVTLLTVWDFMSADDRSILSNYFRKMKKGSHVVMLDIMTNKIPWHQQNLSYKHVDEWQVKQTMMSICGFQVEQRIPVSCANMQVFHKLGKNALAFYLSKLWDKLPFTKPQLECVSWVKA